MHLRHSLVVSLSVPLAPETSLEDVAKFIVLCCDCAGRRQAGMLVLPGPSPLYQKEEPLVLCQHHASQDYTFWFNLGL